MTSTGPERTTAAALGLVGAFQLALAAGAPWGRAAYGGYHPGTPPRRLRGISAVAALAYGGGAVLTLRGTGTPQARRGAFTTLAAFLALGAAVNGASRSPVERALWTPVSAISAVSAWRSRPPR